MNPQLSRRDFLITGASLATAGAAAAQPPSRPPQPNILLIHVDQHRADCLGIAGNPDIRTPNIDALARDGVYYDNSFCVFPVCTPSRYSMLSGQYVFEHGGWSNHATLRQEIPTFPKILREAGYTTQAVGKMHFTPTYLDVGFDALTLSEQNGEGRWEDDYHRYLKEKGLCDFNDLEDQVSEHRHKAPESYWASCGARRSNLPEAHHSTTWVADRAMDQLATWKPQGQLLMVGFIKPHHPFDPPAPWDEKYDPDALTLLPGYTEACLERDQERSTGFFPSKEMTPAALKKAMAYYYAMIEQIDFHIGRMIQHLKEKGLYENTMILFTSDHGEYLGFHHMLLKGNYLYDPLAKVPLIIKYPKQQNPEVTHQLVENIDLAPTILKVAGCAAPACMRGQELRGQQEREIVFAESGYGGEVMARTKTHKLILAPEKERQFFFDLEKDPDELKNEIDTPEYASSIARLRSALEKKRPLDISRRPYLDEDAPIIRQPNALKRDLKRRKAMRSYFAAKMKKIRGEA